MLVQKFSDVYMKFKMHFYQEVFNQINAREVSLSTVEVFCVEVIHALGRPSVNEFANFIHVSSPNAAYKVNSLIQKGYIKKVQSETDKREFHLQVTEKYYKYFNLSQNYVNEIIHRIENRFSKEELEVFDRILDVTSKELMPEVDVPPLNLEDSAE
ncbi:MAG: MarR family winged helix-turn-helix transcriptional regulator [Agathobacter sp.]